MTALFCRRSPFARFGVSFLVCSEFEVAIDTRASFLSSFDGDISVMTSILRTTPINKCLDYDFFLILSHIAKTLATGSASDPG
jgi:hypothetical protein